MLTDKLREMRIREEGQVEEVCSLSEIVVKTVDGELVLDIKGTEYHFSDTGLEALCKMIKVPYRYLGDIPLELQLKNLRNGLSLARDVKISVNGKGQIRGVCSKSYATPPLSQQLALLEEGFTLKNSLLFYQVFAERVYAIVGFPKFSYEKCIPALYFRISDPGGKEEIVCGIYHEGGVFVPLVEPSLYLCMSQSYAKYSAEVTKSVMETMQKVVEEGEETFVASVALSNAPVENSDEWTKALAMTALPKSFIRKLRERETVTRFMLCEMMMTESPSLRNYYDLLVRMSRELNTEFVDLWRE